MTGTHTTTYTTTHTATYLADLLMTSFASILGSLGIDSTQLYTGWAQDQSAISAWIAEQSLEAVLLQCHQPSGVVSPIFRFPVRYTSLGKGDEVFVSDSTALAKYQAKIASVPRGTTFKLLCTFRLPRSEQPGWQATTAASTVGMTSRTIGTLGSAPHASVSAQIYSR